MRNVLQYFGFLLLIKMIALSNCDVINSTKCSTKNISEIVEFNCGDNLMEKHSENFHLFLIKFLENHTETECYDSSNWQSFNKNSSCCLKETNFFSIRNRFFKKTVNLLHNDSSVKLILTNNKETNTVLNQTIFRKFNKINELFIINNYNLTNLNHHTLTYLPKLQVIDLSNNNLKELPEKIFQNTLNLTTIVINRNLIKRFRPYTFRNLEKLKILVLSRNKLENIDPHLFEHLASLIILNLDNNHLTKLSSQIFFTLNNIENLSFAGNKLENLPKDIFVGLKKLVVLSMKNNRFKSLPNDIWSDLNVLKTLNIGHNRFENISGSLLNISSLEKFIANNNAIRFIDKNAFKVAKNLQIINLSHNSLNFYSNKKYSIFSKCMKLKYLILSFNDIQVFYNDWLKLSLNELRLVDLSNNKIMELSFNHNFKHKNNFDIDLSFNKIAVIDFSNLNNAENKTFPEMSLDIRGNPITCDCSVYELLDYINNGMNRNFNKLFNIKIDDLKCNGPEEYNGKLLSRINIYDFLCRGRFDYYRTRNDSLNECTWKKNLKRKLLVVDCDNRKLTQAPRILCQYDCSKFKIELNLRNNLLTEIPYGISSDYQNVTKLFLAGNKIDKFDARIQSTNVEVLELNNNLLTEVNPVKVYMMNLIPNVTLSGNPFICNSNYWDFLVNSKTVSDLAKLNCTNNFSPSESKINSAYMCSIPLEHIYSVWDKSCNKMPLNSSSKVIPSNLLSDYILNKN